MKIKACLKSMRLRTLPLSESGVLLGMFIALSQYNVGFWTIFFLITTTAGLQIVSNLSNELGDTLHGTDTAERQGIHYSIMDGEMTINEMKFLIAASVGGTCLSGLAMIFFSFGTLFTIVPLALICLGGAALLAAMKYTLGSNPYGYRGLGDLFVFIFFGIVSVYGGYFVCSHQLFDFAVLIPAAGIGCFSMGVLNVNNIRDMKTDSGTRVTVAIRMGGRGARIYQTVLIALGWALLVTFAALTASSWTGWIFLVTLPLYGLHIKGIWTKSDRALDPMLPLLVMSTFVTSILFGIGLVI